MTPRPLVLRWADARVDRLHCQANDGPTARALGLVAGAAMLLLALAHRMTSPKIGA